MNFEGRKIHSERPQGRTWNVVECLRTSWNILEKGVTQPHIDSINSAPLKPEREQIPFVGDFPLAQIVR